MDLLFVALFFFCMIDYQDIYWFCRCQSSWRMECACLAWVQMLGGKGWCSARGVGVRELLWKLLLLLASSSSAAAGIYQSLRVVGRRVALSAPWRSRDFAAMDGPDVAPKGRPSTPAWIWQNHGSISAAALAHRQSPRDPCEFSSLLSYSLCGHGSASAAMSRGWVPGANDFALDK